MPFTWVDWAIVAIVAISALISLSRGFVKEALSLLTWIIAGVVAWMFGGSLSVYLAGYIETPSARVIAGCAIMFIATLLVGAMVNYLIGELIRVTGLSGTDRFLGMAFGAAWRVAGGRGGRAVEPGAGTAGFVVAGVGTRAKISIGCRLVQKPHFGVEQSVAGQRNQRTR